MTDKASTLLQFRCTTSDLWTGIIIRWFQFEGTMRKPATTHFYMRQFNVPSTAKPSVDCPSNGSDIIMTSMANGADASLERFRNGRAVLLAIL